LARPAFVFYFKKSICRNFWINGFFVSTEAAAFDGNQYYRHAAQTTPQSGSDGGGYQVKSFLNVVRRLFSLFYVYEV
jgi:hypothetical protein